MKEEVEQAEAKNKVKDAHVVVSNAARAYEVARAILPYFR